MNKMDHFIDDNNGDQNNINNENNSIGIILIINANKDTMERNITNSPTP